MDTTLVQLPTTRPASNGHQPNGAQANPPPRARTRTMVVIGVIALALFAGALAWGLVYRFDHSRIGVASDTAVAASAPTQVTVVHPIASTSAAWSLPGNTQAIQDAIIYARVSGYLSKRYVDIGDQVKAGQLLAEIQSPELDQQLSQAQANLQQAYKQLDLQKADLELARVTLERYKGADQEQAVAKLQVDQAVATYGTAQASVAAAQATVDSNAANVHQFEALTAFERVVAPFDGTITQRNVDVGALITAGSPTNNTSAAPTSVSGAPTGLFEVAQLGTLRVFVSVPQALAKNVTPGQPVQVTVRGALDSPVTASVTRTADALDAGTRTLLTEVDIPNASHELLPGTFVYVAFKLGTSGQRWNLPATAMIFDSKGTQLLLVDPDGKLRLQKVTLGRDFGDTIDVQAGLKGDETIVRQPDVSLVEGQVVTPVEGDHAPQH